MNSRERVLLSLAHKEPDRVPCFYRAEEHFQNKVSTELKDYIDSVTDIGDYLNLKSNSYYDEENKISYDELGVGRKFAKYYWDIVKFPLAEFDDIKQLEDFKWPNFSDKEIRSNHLKKEAKEIRDKNKIVPVMGSWGGSTGIFETSWYMRGLENFLMDLLINVEFAEKLLDIQLELHKKRFSIILDKIGDMADMICLGDDLATQNSLLIAPQTYKDIIKPRQKELIDFIKSKTDAYIYYHSCGAIEKLIPDLIEIGVDILDPIQPLSIDVENLKQKYGKQISFYGSVDVQYVLPYGSKTDVIKEAELRFNQLGKDGGFIIGPSHWIQADTPTENVETLYNTIEGLKY